MRGWHRRVHPTERASSSRRHPWRRDDWRSAGAEQPSVARTPCRGWAAGAQLVPESRAVTTYSLESEPLESRTKRLDARSPRTPRTLGRHGRDVRLTAMRRERGSLGGQWHIRTAGTTASSSWRRRYSAYIPFGLEQNGPLSILGRLQPIESAQVLLNGGGGSCTAWRRSRRLN